MINKTIIRKLATPAAYSRGLDLFYLNRILQLTVEHTDEETDMITALVKGSGRNQYTVSGLYDREHDQAQIRCECSAYHSIQGLCKHCIAVLLEYEQRRREDEDTLGKLLRHSQDMDTLASLKGMQGFQGSGKRISPVQTAAGRQFTGNIQAPGRVNRQEEAWSITTPSMKKLLEQQTLKKLLPVTQGDIYGKVKLVPCLSEELGRFQVEFRIGITQMYVMKDIFSFAELVRTTGNYRYGAKLEFVHSMTAFEAESVPLVRFLLNWVGQNRERYEQTRYTYQGAFHYTTFLPKLRHIVLTTSMLEELLLVMGPQPFNAYIGDDGEQSWQVTTEKMPARLRIKEVAGGISVEVNRTLLVESPNYLICFDENKIYLTPLQEIAPVVDFIRCMSELPTRTAMIGKKEIPAFCRELLPGLKQVYDCDLTDFSEEAYGLCPVAFRIYLDAPQKNEITIKLVAVYGEREYLPLSDQSDAQLRDMLTEIEVGKVVTSYCNAYEEKTSLSVIHDDEDKIYTLLTEGIPHFQTLGEVFVSDAFRRISVLSAPKISVGVSLGSGVMELTLTAEDMPKEQLIELLSKYDRKRKFFRLKSGEFITTDDAIGQLAELRKELALTDKELKKDTIAVPKYRALYLDEELAELGDVGMLQSADYRQLVADMKSMQAQEYEIPYSLEEVLRQYQKQGFFWIKSLKENGFGGILADDMGLGKTLQVICYLLAEYQDAEMTENRRCLIVSPASLVYNWQSELERFAPVLPIKVIVGSAQEREKLIASATDRDIMLTSYDLLRRDVELYENLTFSCQVIDEAQYIKNHTTQAARAVKTIRADFKLALTGTPVENRLSELWSIFDYLMPGFLYSYKRFREELEVPIVQEENEEKLHRLQKMIHPFVLRRLKKEVLLDLPDKLEENRYARMEGEQQQLYDAHVKRIQLLLDKKSDEEFKKSKIQVLSELTKLRQLCCDPALLFENYSGSSAKLELCMDTLQSAVDNGHKILLFSQFTSMLEILTQRMRDAGIDFYVLTGATSKEKRRELVDAFNRDATPVFCISLKAGGTGLNLTAADIVIHYDPWWNVAVQNQATDRAHRIGQTNVVNVYRLITKGTIEENIVKLQEQKRELADKVLSGESMTESGFSREELMELLQ